jgi:peptide/nickel transport system substrate-binding protein
LTIESLARLTDDGRLAPWLARDWLVSSDRRTVTVNLRSGVKFHDGSLLTADLVANAVKAALPGFMGPAAEDVESVSAANAEQIVIRLRQPSAFLLDALETTIQKPGSPHIGTGPFVLSDPKSPTDMHANAGYYLGKPSIDRVTVEAFPSVRAAWAEMLRGRIDMLYEVGIDALDSLEASSNISIHTFSRRYQYVVMLNTQTDAFRPKDVRRALNLAVDRDAIVREALNGHGTASTGPVWPHNYAFRKDAPVFRRDVNTAAEILAAKNRKLGHGERALHFTLLVRPDAVHERIALTLKRQLQSVGVDVTVEETPVDRLVASMKDRRFEAMLIEMISGPSLLRPYQMWHSGGAANATNSTIDTALDRIRHSASDEESSSGVAAFQQAVMDDPPAIFLAWMDRARAVSKRFEVPPAEAGRDILSNMRLWKPRTNLQDAARN